MKRKFLKSTFILLLGGLLTKLLGMIIKISMADLLGSEGIGMYMMVLPTFLLFMNLAQMGLPLALSKLVSEETRKTRNLYFSIIPIILFINSLLIIGIIVLAPFISNTLLKKEETYLSIIAIAFVIPFTTLSSICRSYFLGKGKMSPHVISNIVEDLVRLLLIRILIPKIIPLGLKYTTFFLISFNIVSELLSTMVLLLFLPKNVKIKKSDLKPNKEYQKESLKIGIPNTTSRIIGSTTMFLEPIVLTNGLLKAHYTIDYITKQYGIISGYVLPILLLPSFFTQAISQAIFPILSKDYAKKEKKQLKMHLNLSIFLCLLIGIPITIVLRKNPIFFLKHIYHTKEGISYLTFLAPICLLEYIQSPLGIFLEAINKSKENMKASFLGMLSRTILLWFFTKHNFGIKSLLLSISFNIILTTLYQTIQIKKYFKNDKI